MQNEIRLRGNKIPTNFFFWVWVIISLVGSGSVLLVVPLSGSLALFNLKALGLGNLLIWCYLVPFWYWMQFPIITIEPGLLKVQKWFLRKWQIDLFSIKQIKIRQQFVNTPRTRVFPWMRIYWRMRIYYVDDNRDKYLDIDLVNLSQHQVDCLLRALKRIRPDLDIPPTLDQRGALARLLR